MNEVKAYQVPNLLQALPSVVITSDTSPSTDSNTTATNLITNVGNRSSNFNYPIATVDSGLASYYSCYKVTEVEISPTGHIFKLGFDLGDIYF